VSIRTASGVTSATSGAPVTIPIGQSVTQTLTLTPAAGTPDNTTLSATVNVGPGVTQDVVSVLSVTPNPGTLATAGQAVDVSADIYAGVVNPRQAQVLYTVTDSNSHTIFTATPVPINLYNLPQTTTLDLGSFDTSSLSAGAYTITVTVEETSGQAIAGATRTAVLPIGEPVTGTLTINSDTITAGADTAFSTLTVTNQTQGSLAVTAEVDVPITGATLNTGSFSIAPNQIIAGANSEQLIWNLNLAAGTLQQITWSSTIANLQAGQVQTVALGGLLTFVNNGNNVQTALPALAVAGLPTEQSTGIDLNVVSAQVLALSQAATAAGEVTSNSNDQNLGQTLTTLESFINQLQTTPTNTTALSDVQFELNNVGRVLTVSEDPNQTALVSALQPLQNEANSGDVTDLLADLPTFFNNLASILTVEATEQFTISMTPTSVDLGTGQSQVFPVQLTNAGPDAVTVMLSAANVPTGVTATFAQTQVTLAVGATQTVNLTLTQTQEVNVEFTLAVTAAASVAQQTATAIVTIHAAVANVLSVPATPQQVNPGEPVEVTAQVFNTANVARNEEARLQILDSSGHVLSTLPLVPVTLVPGSGNATVDLGQVPTTGLAAGVYTVEVALLTPAGDPLPGQAAATIFSVGQTIPFSVTASPTVVPPGNSTVTTTITFANQTANPIGPASAKGKGASCTWEWTPAPTGSISATRPRWPWLKILRPSRPAASPIRRSASWKTVISPVRPRRWDCSRKPASPN
jgi:hypothetical protein